MKYTTNTDLFNEVACFAIWLNDKNLPTREEFGLRILKVCEEAGEAAEAWIGYTGQNPRKGITHTKDQVCNELIDVVFSALVALESLGVSTPTVLHNRLIEFKARRLG